MKLKSFIAFFFAIYLINNLQAQLSKKHYIPPLTYAELGNANPNEQFMYLSTPSEEDVTYIIKQVGSSNDITGIVSRNNPQQITIGNGDSQLFVDSRQTSVVHDNKGFIVEASDVIYVSLRVLGGDEGTGSPQAGALVSKGISALGTTFRAGMYTNEVPQDNFLNFISVMATENNTQVTFDDLTPGLDIKNYTGTFPITRTLDEGESYVVATNAFDNTINRDGLIGTLINSDKPIVVNSGSANGSFDDGGGRDYGFDQIVGLENVGNDYIFVRGGGNNGIENILIVAHQDNTQVEINNNGNPVTINSGEYTLIEGNEYDNNGNMFVKTSNPVFAYQGVGSGGSANQGMFFVPPLSCENREIVDNIPIIENIGSTIFTGGITVVTNINASININNQPIGNFSPSGPFEIDTDGDGNSDYKTYRVINLTGNVKVESTEELYCAYFNVNGAATSGGFYSGFPTAPEINFNTAVTSLGNCIPNVTLQASNTDLFDSYSWEFFNENTSQWENIGNPNTEYTPLESEVGKYRLIGTLSCTGASYTSAEIIVSSCPEDYDSDLIIDNLDVDLDNDGILNCEESLGDASINIVDVNNPEIIFQDGSTDNSIISSNITSDLASSSITGSNNGDFVATVAPNTADSDLLYELNFTENVNVKFTGSLAPTNNNEVFYIVKIKPNIKNITVQNPNNEILIDTNTDGDFESGVTSFSASEIHFKYNANYTGNSGSYQFSAHHVNQFSFEIKSNGITTSSSFNGNIILTCFARDTDGDGVEDALDLDSDNDGIPDRNEGYPQVNALSGTDNNQDGLDDIFESIPNLDTDNDGVFNFIDIDSDNDGIYDTTEAGHNLDSDFDGVIDNANSLTGVNGLVNTLETTLDAIAISLNYTIVDSDNDSNFNFIELDSDNDNCFDVTEAGFTDTNNNGILDASPFAISTNGRVINNIDGYTNPNLDYITSAPIIINTPFVDVTFCEDETSTIIIDSDVDSYQWQLSSNDGISFIDISENLTIDGTIFNNVTTRELRIENASLTVDDYKFRVLLNKFGNTCGDVSNEITLTINPKPQILNSVVQLNQCADNPSEITTVNLTEAEINISTNANVTFEYYETESLAIAGGSANQITNIESYPVNQTAEAWVRTVSNEGCYTISKVEIIATFVSDITYDKIFEECDDFLDSDGNDNTENSEVDGITNFNFSNATNEIKARFPNPNDIEVSFYETITDRTNNVNEIPNISNHRNNADPSYAFEQTIYFKITNVNNNNCEGLGKLFLRVNAIPEFTVQGESPNDPILVCTDNLPYTLQAENIGGNYTYRWTDENNNVLGINQEQIINGAGNYTVTAFTTNNCPKSRTITVIQSDSAFLDESYVTITDDLNNTGNLSVIIDIPQNSQNIEEYLYSLETVNGFTIKPFQESNIFTDIEGGIYNLIVENKNGCGRSELLISVIQFPKFFTPNNDGINDTWFIKGVSSTFYSESIMEVYNRFGKLLYKTENQNSGWNGFYGGKILNEGGYWYKVILKPTDTTKPIILKKGNFTLLR